MEVRSVAPDSNPYMVMLAVFQSGLDGSISSEDGLRQAKRFLPDNIYDAIANFQFCPWTAELLGEDVKGRYADLKQASADRCARLLGTFVKAPEVQFHHEVYNQFLLESVLTATQSPHRAKRGAGDLARWLFAAAQRLFETQDPPAKPGILRPEGPLGVRQARRIACRCARCTRPLRLSCLPSTSPSRR